MEHATDSKHTLGGCSKVSMMLCCVSRLFKVHGSISSDIVSLLNETHYKKNCLYRISPTYGDMLSVHVKTLFRERLVIYGLF